MDKATRKRTEVQRTRILRALLDGPKYNIELTEIGLRYTARIKELRDMGYTIRTGNRLKDGRVLYTLKTKGG